MSTPRVPPTTTPAAPTTSPAAPTTSPATTAATNPAAAAAAAAAEEARKRDEERERFIKQPNALAEINAEELRKILVPEFYPYKGAVSELDKDKHETGSFSMGSSSAAKKGKGAYHRQGSAYVVHLDENGNTSITLADEKTVAKAKNYGSTPDFLKPFGSFWKFNTKEMLRDQMLLLESMGYKKFTFDSKDPEVVKIIMELVNERNAIRKSAGMCPVIAYESDAIKKMVDEAPPEEGMGHGSYEERKAREKPREWYERGLKDLRDQQKKLEEEVRAFDSKPENTLTSTALQSKQYKGMAQEINADTTASMSSNAAGAAPPTQAELEQKLKSIEDRLNHIKWAKEKFTEDFDPLSKCDLANTNLDLLSKRNNMMRNGGSVLQKAINEGLEDLTNLAEVYTAQSNASVPQATSDKLARLKREIDDFKRTPILQPSDALQTNIDRQVAAQAQAQQSPPPLANR